MPLIYKYTVTVTETTKLTPVGMMLQSILIVVTVSPQLKNQEPTFFNKNKRKTSYSGIYGVGTDHEHHRLDHEKQGRKGRNRTSGENRQHLQMLKYFIISRKLAMLEFTSYPLLLFFGCFRSCKIAAFLFRNKNKTKIICSCCKFVK